MSCCNTNQSNQTVSARPVEATRTEAAFRPNVDIFETGNDWLVVADVPGATSESVDLNLEDGILSVTAKVPARGPGESGFLRREYGVSNFERRFRIGEGVDAEGIEASIDSGVLTIRLPKAASVKPRKIDIRSN